VIGPPSGTQIWIAAGVTDMRRGMYGLAALVDIHLHAKFLLSGELMARSTLAK